jgi:hypothetical protein
MISAYYPQSNGLVERFHPRLKDAFCVRAVTSDWLRHFPCILLGLRAVP